MALKAPPTEDGWLCAQMSTHLDSAINFFTAINYGMRKHCSNWSRVQFRKQIHQKFIRGIAAMKQIQGDNKIRLLVK